MPVVRIKGRFAKAAETGTCGCGKTIQLHEDVFLGRTWYQDSTSDWATAVGMHADCLHDYIDGLRKDGYKVILQTPSGTDTILPDWIEKDMPGGVMKGRRLIAMILDPQPFRTGEDIWEWTPKPPTHCWKGQDPENTGAHVHLSCPDHCNRAGGEGCKWHLERREDGTWIWRNTEEDHEGP